MHYVWLIPLLFAMLLAIAALYLAVARNSPRVSDRCVEGALAEDLEENERQQRQPLSPEI